MEKSDLEFYMEKAIQQAKIAGRNDDFQYLLLSYR